MTMPAIAAPLRLSERAGTKIVMKLYFSKPKIDNIETKQRLGVHLMSLFVYCVVGCGQHAVFKQPACRVVHSLHSLISDLWNKQPVKTPRKVSTTFTIARS